MTADDQTRRRAILRWCTLLGGVLTINFLLGYLMPHAPLLPYPEYEQIWQGMSDAERQEMVPDMRWQANEQAKAKHTQLRALWIISSIGPLLLAVSVILRITVGHMWLRRIGRTRPTN